MPRSVHISTLIPPPLSMVKRLRIPKARQKQLLAIMDQARQRTATANPRELSDGLRQGKKLLSASAAR